MVGLIVLLAFLFQAPAASTGAPKIEKSPYFAFVDRDYIFTIEMVKPGIPILNFVSMTDEERRIYAKDIRLSLANRKVVPRLLSIETGEFQKPMSLASIAVHPRSSFGVRIDGELGDAKELYGATIRFGDEELELAPMSSFDFEALVLKVNRLNLESPDFSDDWRVLKLSTIGARSPVRKRSTR